MKNKRFHEGQIIEFVNPESGITYDGIVWRVLREDETNISFVVRYVDEVVV